MKFRAMAVRRFIALLLGERGDCGSTCYGTANGRTAVQLTNGRAADYDFDLATTRASSSVARKLSLTLPGIDSACRMHAGCPHHLHANDRTRGRRLLMALSGYGFARRRACCGGKCEIRRTVMRRTETNGRMTIA